MTSVSPFLVGALLTLAVTAAEAAPRLGPPSLFMQGERHRSAVVKVLEVVGEGRLRVELLERLRGETPDQLEVRGAPGDRIEVGGVYILGHTDRPARRTHRFDTDPAGPRLLNVPAVGAALFEDSVAMRTLLRERPDDDPLTDRRRLDAVVEQVGRPDVQSRRFVLVELALDPELRELVGESDLGVLRQVLESDELEPVAHDYLLRAALPMIEDWGRDWLAADCRRELARHGTELDLASLVPALLVTTLGTLERTGTEADALLASRHVESNNPGVGKAAFAAMVALDQDLAAKRAPGYLANSTLHQDTRRFIRQLQARVTDDPTGG